ncbi:MAG TPA: DinB family protein [Candidatus Saccharimonadia bacterium]
MDTNEILIDGFSRVDEAVRKVLGGLSEEDLSFRPSPAANSIAWLVWHLARIQDDHLAGVADQPQVWPQGWSDRFGLPFDESATGWGHGPDEVAAVKVSGRLLGGYYEAVHRVTLDYIRDLKPVDYGRVVDKNWDPPVMLGVRLVSVLADDLQHVGQAAYVRGLIERR